jgi:hypothetical protein
MMTFEEWIKIGRPFLNTESRKWIDKFEDGEISIDSLLDIICEEYLKQRNTPHIESSNPCYGCAHHTCLYSMFYDSNKTEEENEEEFCYGCPCGDGLECNRDSGKCTNYEIYPVLI